MDTGEACDKNDECCSGDCCDEYKVCLPPGDYSYEEESTDEDMIMPLCEDAGPVPGAYAGPCVHAASKGGAKVMFKSADGQLQEMDDLQQFNGKKILFKDSEGNLQELSLEAGGEASSSMGNKASTSGIVVFVTSPLMVIAVLAVAVLGVIMAAQRRLHRSVTYEPLESNHSMDDIVFSDGDDFLNKP